MTPAGASASFRKAYGRDPGPNDVGRVFEHDGIVYRVTAVGDGVWATQSVLPAPKVVRVDLGAAYSAALTLAVGVALGLSLGALALAVAL